MSAFAEQLTDNQWIVRTRCRDCDTPMIMPCTTKKGPVDMGPFGDPKVRRNVLHFADMLICNDCDQPPPVNVKPIDPLPIDMRAAAIAALRQHGVDNPLELVDLLPPQKILATCAWFARQRNVRVGLLVWKIRNGGVEDVEAPVSRRQTPPPYDSSALPLFWKPHAQWDIQRGYPVECPDGKLFIVDNGGMWPLEVECDHCDFTSGILWRNASPELCATLKCPVYDLSRAHKGVREIRERGWQ